MTCFDSELSEYLYSLTSPVALNLPVNFTASVHDHTLGAEAVETDLYAQVRAAEAALSGVYANCVNRTGDVVAFMGTKFVVRDIDYMSKILEGSEAKINFWGFSYVREPLCTLWRRSAHWLQHVGNHYWSIPLGQLATGSTRTNYH